MPSAGRRIAVHAARPDALLPLRVRGHPRRTPRTDRGQVDFGLATGQLASGPALGVDIAAAIDFAFDPGVHVFEVQRRLTGFESKRVA